MERLMTIIQLQAQLESLESQKGSPANGESSSKAVNLRARRKATELQLLGQKELRKVLLAKPQELGEVDPDIRNSKQGGSGAAMVTTQLQEQLKSLEGERSPPTNGESFSLAVTRRSLHHYSTKSEKIGASPTDFRVCHSASTYHSASFPPQCADNGAFARHTTE